MMLSIIITILWQQTSNTPYLGLKRKWSSYAQNAVRQRPLWSAVTLAIDSQGAGSATTESATTGTQPLRYLRWTTKDSKKSPT